MEKDIAREKYVVVFAGLGALQRESLQDEPRLRAIRLLVFSEKGAG
jgi:hypothetical protein